MTVCYKKGLVTSIQMKKAILHTG